MTQPSQSNQPHTPGQAPQSGTQPRPLTPQELAGIPKPSSAAAAPPAAPKTQAAPSREVTPPPPAAGGLQVPTLRPESPEAGAAAAAGAKWLYDHVTALWSMNQDRNAWVYLGNTGWVKLSNASESGIVAMSMLAAYAKLSQDYASCYQGNDGEIHYFYAW